MKIFFDIETCPEGDINDVEVKVPGNYKKPESIDAYIEEHREEAYRKRALEGISGQIVSIAWAFDDYIIESVTRSYLNSVTSEADLLAIFFDAIQDHMATLQPQDRFPVLWIGHHCIDFDLRFLKQRCWINGVKPSIAIPADARHGDWVFDCAKEWAGWKGYVKQNALYAALGGEPFEGDDIDGSMIYDLWKAGDLETIQAYNERDVAKVIHNWRALTWNL